MKTISGKLVGKSGNIVVRYDEVGKRVVGQVRLLGRWLYVRKCRRPDKIGDIAICYKSQNDIPVAVVMAVGDGCGKWHKLSEDQKKMGMLPQVEIPEDIIGKKILVPDKHEWGILDLDFDKDEFLIHECIAKMIID